MGLVVRWDLGEGKKALFIGREIVLFPLAEGA